MNILKEKNFRNLMIGKFSSLLGSNMQQFALSLYVLSITGSALIFSSMLAISIIPRILLSPVGGVFGDWFDRKKTIIRLDLINGFLIGCFALYFYINDGMSLISIYILVFLLEIVEIFFDSAMGAVIPSIMPKERLLEANSIKSMIDSISNIASPLIASSLYAFFGMQLLLVINSISFILSAILEMTLEIPKYNKEPEKVDFHNFKKDFISGITVLKKHKILVNIIAFGVFLNFSIGPLLSVGLIFLFFKILHSTEIQYGILTTCIGISMLLAPVIVGKKAKSMDIGKLAIQTFFVISIIILLIAFFSSNIFINYFDTTLVPMLAIGIMVCIVTLLSTIVNISLGTLLQTIVPRDFISRIGSVMNLGLLASIPLGQILFGLLVEKISISLTIIFVGIIVLLATIYFKKPFITNEQEEEPCNINFSPLKAKS